LKIKITSIILLYGLITVIFIIVVVLKLNKSEVEIENTKFPFSKNSYDKDLLNTFLNSKNIF
jgi:hypothetical protein